jgi:hypothetical protein
VNPRTRYFLMPVVVAVGISTVAFFCGTIMALADPTNGWQAWRVGLLVGAITFLVVLVIGALFSLVTWADTEAKRIK